MAHQQGIFRYSGKIDDAVFYRRKKGDYVKSASKEKYNLSANTIKSGTDFGLASRTGKHIRVAFSPIVKKHSDSGHINRLNSALVKVLNTVPDRYKGKKKLKYGDLILLRSFNFNEFTKLENLVKRTPEIKINSEGRLYLGLAACQTEQLFDVVPRAKEICIRIMIYNFDLNTGEYELFHAPDLLVSLKEKHYQGAHFELQTEQKTERALMVCMAVSYQLKKLSEHSDITFQSGNRLHYAAGLIEVLHLKKGKAVQFKYPKVSKAVQLDPEFTEGLCWKSGI